MKVKITILSLLLCLMTVALVTAQDSPLNEAARNACEIIATDGSGGSGTLLATEDTDCCYVVTCGHLFRTRGQRCRVEFTDSRRKYPGVCIYRTMRDNADIAYVKVQGRPPHPGAVIGGSAKVVAWAGYSYRGLLTYTGQVARKSANMVAVRPDSRRVGSVSGMSGGPVFCQRTGALVSVLYGYDGQGLMLCNTTQTVVRTARQAGIRCVQRPIFKRTLPFGKKRCPDQCYCCPPQQPFPEPLPEPIPLPLPEPEPAPPVALQLPAQRIRLIQAPPQVYQLPAPQPQVRIEYRDRIVERIVPQIQERLIPIAGPAGRPGRDGIDGVSIQGPRGERGERGEPGQPGRDGVLPAMPRIAIQLVDRQGNLLRQQVRDLNAGDAVFQIIYDPANLDLPEDASVPQQ